MYEIDEAMLGSEFDPPNREMKNQYLRTMAQYLTTHGYETVVITDSVNGASNEFEIPESTWNKAMSFADLQFAEKFWRQS